MAEVVFAKSYLSVLDTKPVKLSADHAEDPRTYPARAAYTLPKMSRPMNKPQNTTIAGDSSTSSAPAGGAPGSERSYTVQLTSARNPPLDVSLSSQSINTSVLDLKSAIADQTGLATDKIKLLHNKKPVGDSKILKDILGSPEAIASATKVEFSVMIMGGAAALAAAEAAKNATTSDVAQGPSGDEVLETAEFWDDLRGFLLQRVRDEKAAGNLADTFHAAWKAKR